MPDRMPLRPEVERPGMSAPQEFGGWRNDAGVVEPFSLSALFFAFVVRYVLRRDAYLILPVVRANSQRPVVRANGQGQWAGPVGRASGQGQ